MLLTNQLNPSWHEGDRVMVKPNKDAGRNSAIRGKVVAAKKVNSKWTYTVEDSKSVQISGVAAADLKLDLSGA
jgi:hypothetical protein